MRTVVALFLLAVAAYAAPLLYSDSPLAIKGSYIVVLRENIGKPALDAHILALKNTILATENESSEIVRTYKIGSFLGFHARLSTNMLKTELNHPDVIYVEADQVVTVAAYTTQPNAPSWGLGRIDQRERLPVNADFSYNNSAGAGVDVYVLDTGILTTHVDFGGRASTVFNAISGETDPDQNGHGTHCAGTIGGTTYGVAKLVTLYAVKVLSAAGSGSTAGVVGGIDYVTNNFDHNRPSVASMSLGGGASTALDSAVASSVAAGVVYSVAAGNSNANACLYSPARAPTAVTVGATTSTDARSSFSNIGTCVDIFAPGSSITSDWIGSNTATNTISGTSMACPHVSGVLALYLSGVSGPVTPAAAATWLTSTATSGVITNPGTGSPNLLLYSPYA